ncbi:uncharacterized protein LAESUDRAFT_726806 [Laetiporus sulphureus 93-53]|uniref:Uncharacterized protein n=1 Tax=Laetiporus sulphureus 93-53 TaxID=1314785 RepID=A0A165DSH1_9APHY|nr:uncharacterized protein LAESUDRAFT_726806 [Laetiporus sulphureus 93-53]KZT05539.1 hypothetical protein LAESUDRAFT_726806 [Laetiporus sulphureus 93-53]
MPPRVQPKTYILPLKTHKLTAYLTAGIGDTINSVKQKALSALTTEVLDTPNPHAAMGMPVDDEPEWTVPKISGLQDFELSRGIKERGRITGRYELLDSSTTVKSVLVNWDTLFVQFRDENGDLLPVKVSLPPLDDDEEAELAAARKGKRKAHPET